MRTAYMYTFSWSWAKKMKEESKTAVDTKNPAFEQVKLPELKTPKSSK